ncbi:LuxR C-terminal-related transcriptional regulator [Alkaliflexus imshenetskii]|uniref:LuxR C-terminal-related transcriptional regulator n=1 Tax=Alkaliflexus imshenetskii TaxID=286730 RepID=UPI00047AB507|nr:LuxR C-terminal-related transcriptional regulator [Alkaliflexus imshenetskii]
MKATISGDIIASTALSTKGRAALEKRLKKLIQLLKKEFGIYARVIKGDYLECYIPDPEEALRVALIIKCFIKSHPIDVKSKKREIALFRMHGIRLAIGLGPITRFNPRKGIIDGEAIYLSGRLISRQSNPHGERMVIKSTLFIDATIRPVVDEFEPVLALLDVLLAKCTARQCEVLTLKLTGLNEETIASQLKITQATVNQHSRSAGWNAIEKTVNRFNQAIKNLPK